MPKKAKGNKSEGLQVERYKQALYAAIGTFQENLGINFPPPEARELSMQVITLYYEEFYEYLVALDLFIDRASRIIVKINKPGINDYFNNRAVKIVSQYFLDIIAMNNYEEFIAEILELVRDVVGYKLIEEV